MSKDFTRELSPRLLNIEDKNRSNLSMAIVDTLFAYVMNSGYTYTNFEVEITKKKRATTRHTVLHGIQPDYHYQTNSLRAFLLLDALLILKDSKFPNTDLPNHSVQATRAVARRISGAI